MSARPLVSVIVPVFNGEHYLAAALTSVLAQSHRPLEVLVVDDGSTDASAAVAARHPPVRCLQQAHAGKSAAVNCGVRETRGNLLAFLDADDLWMPSKTTLQLQALDDDPSLDAVFGHVEQFVSPDLDEPARRRLRCNAQAMSGPCIGTLLIRRTAFERAGDLDPRWPTGEFLDWYARAVDAGVTMRVLPNVVLRRRLHATNLSRTPARSPKHFLPILRAAIARRGGSR